MRVIYADPGLIDISGHHPNFCRLMRTEWQRRGVEVRVLAHAEVSASLRAELGAAPWFSGFTYRLTDGDPVSGWLDALDRTARATFRDLGRIDDITADDLLYMNSAQPAQLLALIQWLQTRPVENRPYAVLEFGSDPGVDVAIGPAGGLQVSLRDYRVDPRPMFYRFAAGKLTEADLARFAMVTFDERVSAVYGAVLKRPVGVLPQPFGVSSFTSRAGRRPITVAVLGHQRPEKGYPLMPEIAVQLLAEEPGVRLLIQNGGGDEMPKVQQRLRDFAATEPRLTLIEETGSADQWAALLDRSDLILCPYPETRYAASYSGIAMDAVANAIPLVVPARTTLAHLVTTYGGSGILFDRQTPAEITAATRLALAEFDRLATSAMAAAGRWNATMGVAHLVDAMQARRDAAR